MSPREEVEATRKFARFYLRVVQVAVVLMALMLFTAATLAR